MTELERYSAKGFVSKPSSNKGERKQNSWVEVIKTVMNLSTLSRQQRELVQTISNFDNIPRKKAKFQVNLNCTIIRFHIQLTSSHTVIHDTKLK